MFEISSKFLPLHDPDILAFLYYISLVLWGLKIFFFSLPWLTNNHSWTRVSFTNQRWFQNVYKQNLDYASSSQNLTWMQQISHTNVYFEIWWSSSVFDGLLIKLLHFVMSELYLDVSSYLFKLTSSPIYVTCKLASINLQKCLCGCWVQVSMC